MCRLSVVLTPFPLPACLPHLTPSQAPECLTLCLPIPEVSPLLSFGLHTCQMVEPLRVLFPSPGVSRREDKLKWGATYASFHCDFSPPSGPLWLISVARTPRWAQAAPQKWPFEQCMAQPSTSPYPHRLTIPPASPPIPGWTRR